MEEPAQEVPIAAANQARIAYLASHGVTVPIEQMYVTSLLEYLLGDGLGAAREYHEGRVAVILDQAVTRFGAAEEQRRSAQARAVLLQGIGPR
jgi:hypothetical protein